MSKYIYKQILIIGLIGAIVFSSRITEYPTEAATTKITYRIENKQQIKKSKKLTAKYLYQLPQIKGNSSAIQKINKSLIQDYKSTFQYKKNLFNYFEELKNSSYKNIYYTNKCSVTYNRNGYICFRFISKWYAGGVGETREYGLTYRLKDGKKLGVQDVVSGKKSDVKKNIATTYSKKITKYGYSSIMKMKYSDIQFYIKPGKKVFVCFGPYIPGGGHGHVSIELKGKL